MEDQNSNDIDNLKAIDTLSGQIFSLLSGLCYATAKKTLENCIALLPYHSKVTDGS